MSNDDDFPLVAGVILIGMSFPIAVAFHSHSVLSLYLTGRQYSYLAAVGFVLLVWVVIAMRAPDRMNLLLGLLILPWIVAVVLLFVGVASPANDVFEYVFGDLEGLMEYAAVFMSAGIVAVESYHIAERLPEDHEWIPSPRILAGGLAVAVVAATVVGGGVLHVTARSASISNVETGVIEHETPVLNVTLQGEQTEVRLTVTAPNERTFTTRIPHPTMRAKTATVPVEFYKFESRPLSGTYHIELRGIMGTTIDTASYTVDRGAVPTLQEVVTAGPGENLSLDLPPSSPVYRPSRGLADDETRVGVVIENQGDVASRFETYLLAKETRVSRRAIFIEPGQQGGNILAVPDDEVERIVEETNGTVTVVVIAGGSRVTTETELPRSM